MAWARVGEARLGALVIINGPGAHAAHAYTVYTVIYARRYVRHSLRDFAPSVKFIQLIWGRPLSLVHSEPA